MADGVAADKLYPLDVNRAFKSLTKIKSKIYWWESGAQGSQILIDGEVPVSMEWIGRVELPIDAVHAPQSVWISFLSPIMTDDPAPWSQP